MSQNEQFTEMKEMSRERKEITSYCAKTPHELSVSVGRTTKFFTFFLITSSCAHGHDQTFYF